MQTSLLVRAYKIGDLAILTLALALGAAPWEHAGQFVIAVTSAAVSGSPAIAGGPGSALGGVLAMRVPVKDLLLFGTFLVVWHSLFSLLGLYSPAHGGRIGVRELVAFGKAAAVGGLMLGFLSLAVTTSAESTAVAIAAALTASMPERSYLLVKAARLEGAAAPR